MYDVVTNRQEEIDEKRDEVCVILSKAGQCYRRLVWKRHHDLVRTMPTCPLRVIVFPSPPITLPVLRITVHVLARAVFYPWSSLSRWHGRRRFMFC
jgi:hypothetical protein